MELTATNSQMQVNYWSNSSSSNNYGSSQTSSSPESYPEILRGTLAVFYQFLDTPILDIGKIVVEQEPLDEKAEVLQ